MAKQVKPTRTTKTPAARAAAPVARRWLRRVLAHGILASLLAGTLAMGYYYALAEVQSTNTSSDDPPRVALRQRPPWMSDEVVADLLRSIAPHEPHSVYDSGLLKHCAEVLESNPWVRKVVAVRRVYGRAPGDTIEVECEFRTPMALVRWQDYYWLVDSEGCKLPEQYTAAQAPQMLFDAQRRTQMRIIEGVRQPPVESGRRWPGEDLLAALELSRLLQNQRFADDVLKIDVSNFGGRVDPREAQLTLITRFGSEIRWGRPANAKDAFVEVPAQRKLEALEQIYAKFGRVDAMQPWIDIRFDQVTYPAQADTSR